MSRGRAVKLGAIAFIVVAVAILLYTAASDKIFFGTIPARSADAVYDVENGYEFYFYSDKTDHKIAIIFYDVGTESGNQLPIIFQILPENKYKVDSLRLEFKMLQPPSALTIKNPESLPFPCTRTDEDSSMVIDAPNLGPEGSETITFNLSLDLLKIEPPADELIVDIQLYIHQESLLKILRYDAKVAIRLDIP